MANDRPERGPGSNQHQDKPPRAPRAPATGAGGSSLPDFLADPFLDGDEASAPAAPSDHIPAWMLGGENTRRTVGDQARHEQDVLAHDARYFSERGDAANVAASDAWAAVYRDFAVSYADDIDATLRTVHRYHGGTKGRLPTYDAMFRSAGMAPRPVDPAHLDVGDAYLTHDPLSRQEAVAVVVARRPTQDGGANLTVIATTMEGFTAAYYETTSKMGATVDTVTLVHGAAAPAE